MSNINETESTNSGVKLNVTECATYNDKLKQELGNYTNVVNAIGDQFDSIGSAWTGSLSENFLSQFEGFLPNLTIGYNIIEKSDSDLGTCVMNIVKIDEEE